MDALSRRGASRSGVLHDSSDIASVSAGPTKLIKAVDLYEERDDIVVKAELPRMEKDNIEVNLSDDR